MCRSTATLRPMKGLALSTSAFPYRFSLYRSIKAIIKKVLVTRKDYLQFRVKLYGIVSFNVVL